jgi:WD40 repeat protein
MLLTTPDGDQYTLQYERKFNFTFQNDFKTKLTIVPDQHLLLANVRQALHIYQTQDKGPVAILDFRSRPNNAFNPSSLPSPSSQITFPTCHSYTPDSDDQYDTLVGLSNGEVIILPLAAQTQTQAAGNGGTTTSAIKGGGIGSSLGDGSILAMSPIKPVAVSMHHQVTSSTSLPTTFDQQLAATGPSSSSTNASTKPSKCVAVTWVPKTAGNLFVAAYQDGTVNLYQKLVGASTDSSLLSTTGGSPSSPGGGLGLGLGLGGSKKSSHQHSLQTRIAQLQVPHSTTSKKGLTPTGTSNALSPSPDGRYIAVASQTGMLSIHDTRTGSVVTGFKGYYGGLLCCAWSGDGALVAAGGEDDLITVFNLEKQCIVAVCEGHSSWVTSIAFDPSYNNNNIDDDKQEEGGMYRLLSVSQDCHLALWEVDVTEEVGVGGFLNSPTSASAAEADALAAAAAAAAGDGGRRAGHRRHISGSDGGSWGGKGWAGNDVSMQSLSVQQHQHHRRGSSSGGSGGGGGGVMGGIVEALQRVDMPLVGPLCMVKIGIDPLSDVVFDGGSGDRGFFVAAYSGNMKRWRIEMESGGGEEVEMDVEETCTNWMVGA